VVSPRGKRLCEPRPRKKAGGQQKEKGRKGRQETSSGGERQKGGEKKKGKQEIGNGKCAGSRLQGKRGIFNSCQKKGTEGDLISCWRVGGLMGEGGRGGGDWKKVVHFFGCKKRRKFLAREGMGRPILGVGQMGHGSGTEGGD